MTNKAITSVSILIEDAKVSKIMIDDKLKFLQSLIKKFITNELIDFRGLKNASCIILVQIKQTHKSFYVHFFIKEIKLTDV